MEGLEPPTPYMRSWGHACVAVARKRSSPTVADENRSRHDSEIEVFS